MNTRTTPGRQQKPKIEDLSAEIAEMKKMFIEQQKMVQSLITNQNTAVVVHDSEKSRKRRRTEESSQSDEDEILDRIPPDEGSDEEPEEFDDQIMEDPEPLLERYVKRRRLDAVEDIGHPCAALFL